MKKLYHILVFLLLMSFSASAQFYVTGDDPGKLKWSYTETAHFRIIYPDGADSLARIYGTDLERFYAPLSRTSGYLPNGNFGKKMPVMIHAYNGANGSVAWAPNRMDLFTLPSAYDPEPLPWNKMLAIHEGRHVSQMQFGMTKAMKPGNYIFGQMWNIAMTLLYPGIAFMEGDAVVTETAYTPSGRGRTSDFLNYYRIAFDEGVERSWQQWRFPSQRNYSPSYYSLGYMAVGGLRYLYDIPEYMNHGFDLSSRRPYNLAAFHTTVKNLTGKKFNTAFKEICDTMAIIWKKEADARAPYIPSRPVTQEPRLYTEYSNGVFVGNDLYTIKRGHLTTPILVKIDSSLTETVISRFASEYGTMKADKKGNLYWSESKPDPRWTLKTVSTVQELKHGKRKSSRIGKGGLQYNPTPTEEGDSAAVVEYSVKGGSVLNIIKTDKKSSIIDSFEAPDTLQLVEAAWSKDCKVIYVTAVSDNGYGIHLLNLETRKWTEMLAPQPVMIKDFKSRDNYLMFTCDRTGVNELYHFYPESGELIQKTSTRHGAEDFVYAPEGHYLYYTMPTLKGKQVFRTSVDSLMNKPVEYSDRHLYPIAEKLTAQEKALAQQRNEAFIPDSTVTLSEPKKYRKFNHAFNLHSWAPLYISVNNIMNMSFDHIYEAASLGVTGIMQNRLATGVGEIGYSAHKDPYNKSQWRHSGHVKYTYSGWYPVFEFAVDFNDRAARQFSATAYTMGKQAGVGINSTEMKAPYFSGRISTYIPFDLSSGGWYRGLIPKLSYTITNDMFKKDMAILSYDPEMGSIERNPVFVGSTGGKTIIRQYLSGSLRAYTMLGTPNSAVYPKWGIGIEAGATGSIGLKKFISPMGYFYTYGYVPGIVPQQGLKLAAMYQRKLSPKSYFGQATVTMVPRGMKNNTSLMNYLSIYNDNLTNFSADYAIPIFIGDLAIGGSFLYVKRMVITPHFDFNLVENKPSLFSAGASLTFSLESVVFLTWPCSVGVTYSYNGGFNGAFQTLGEKAGIEIGRHFVGPVFSVSF